MLWKRLVWTLTLTVCLAGCSEDDKGKSDLGVADGSADTLQPDARAPDAAAPAELILVNGKVITVDSTRPSAEAVAVTGGKIVAVGSTQEIEKLLGPQTKRIDLGGKTVTPGFIDTHLHFLAAGQVEGVLDLRLTSEKSEILQMVTQEIAKLGPGYANAAMGFGWDQNKWTVKDLPTVQDVDPISPNNAVILMRVCGHVMWVNTVVLALAGIDENTPDPPGGTIVKDPTTGKPTGILMDAAMNAVLNLAPSKTGPADYAKAADKRLSSEGITSIGDPGQPYPAGDGGLTIVKLYKDLVDQQKIKTRINLSLSWPGDAVQDYLSKGPEIGYGGDRLTVRAFKMWSDGSLGARTAALIDDYSDEAGNKGQFLLDKVKYAAVLDGALKKGFQVWTHSIGDRANKEVLDLYEQAFKDNPQVTDHRFRIEHVQTIRQQDIARLAQLGVVAAIQPTHGPNEWAWAKDRLGPDRMKLSYLVKSLLDAGVKVAGGSDSPVVPSNPFHGIYTAVTRQDVKQQQTGLSADEKVDRLEALRLFTLDAAYALFEEDIKGSVEVGKLADLVVLSKDILTVPEAEILDTQVEMTIIGGEIVYQAP